MKGRPRRMVPLRTVKLGGDTIGMLRRFARAERPEQAPSLDDAVRQLAKKAGVLVVGIPVDDLGTPETSGPTDGGR